jgi:tetratricopeptide (TPR) repeat protein
MSLLNDALRKKTGEDKIKETGYTESITFAKPKDSKAKLFRILGLPFLLGVLAIGGWYFWGSLSAQVDSPIAAEVVSKHIEENDPDHLPVLPKEKMADLTPVLETPELIGEISPLETPVEKEPKVRVDTPTKPELPREAEKKPPPRKIAKISSSVKKNSLPKRSKVKAKVAKKNAAHQAPKAKERVVSTQQESLFLQKALHYHRQGKFNQAIRMYQQVLKVNATHRDALFNLASAYIHLKVYSEALPLLKKLRNYDYGNPDVLVNLAIVEIGLGKPAEAIQLLNLATQYYKEPKFEIFFHKAAALSRLGRLEEALRNYRTAETLNAQHPILNFNMAVLCDKLHQYKDAVYYYRAYIRNSNSLQQFEEKKIETRIRSLRAYLAENRNS